MPIDIPPVWVLAAAKRSMRDTGHWQECLDFLCVYYGVPRVECRTKPERVSAEAIATYYRQRDHEGPIICTKEADVSSSTMFHEFAHHLHATLLGGRLTSKANEQFAEAYAQATHKVWLSL